MAGRDDEHIERRGKICIIAYATDASGSMPAKDFLESKGKHQPTTQESAGLYQAFKVLADHGVIRNKEQFRKERGEIYGFKKYQARIAAFRIGNTWYLTHGFKKKKNKWPKSELDRAERIRNEHLQRKKDKR